MTFLADRLVQGQRLFNHEWTRMDANLEEKSAPPRVGGYEEGGSPRSVRRGKTKRG
jgi:hypothetical protein